MAIDLTTNYLGLTLNSPLVASASPCTGQPDVLQRLERLGRGSGRPPFTVRGTSNPRGQARKFDRSARQFPLPERLQLRSGSLCPTR